VPALWHPALALLSLPALAWGGYLLVLALLSARNPAPPRSTGRLRFDVLVPAHDEAAGIARCVASLRALDWPGDRFRVIVIADNCGDDTAARARAAGAEVWERNDASARGKGHALAYAFARSRAERYAYAVVVVDADTEATPNLLEACAARIEAGAEAIQAHYGVRDPDGSWRARLMAIAYALFHTLRSRARERLGLSCGIRGNGWCVTHALLERAPYRAYSITEDIELGNTLGLAGCRVHYAGEAEVRADAAVSRAEAARQRQRWEGGRYALIRAQAPPLLRAAVARRDRVCLDLALDLLVLPLSWIALYDLGLLALAALAARVDPALAPWAWLAAFAAGCVAVYVARGVALSGRGLRGVLDLAAAPLFVAWKLATLLRPFDRATWVPTRRRAP